MESPETDQIPHKNKLKQKVAAVCRGIETGKQAFKKGVIANWGWFRQKTAINGTFCELLWFESFLVFPFPQIAILRQHFHCFYIEAFDQSFLTN